MLCYEHTDEHGGQGILTPLELHGVSFRSVPQCRGSALRGRYWVSEDGVYFTPGAFAPCTDGLGADGVPRARPQLVAVTLASVAHPHYNKAWKWDNSHKGKVHTACSAD